MLSRRGLITGLISFAAAPAIVRAASLMPVKALKLSGPIMLNGVELVFDGGFDPTVISLLNRRMDAAYTEMRWYMTQNLYGDEPAFKGLSLLGDLTV